MVVSGLNKGFVILRRLYTKGEKIEKEAALIILNKSQVPLELIWEIGHYLG